MNPIHYKNNFRLLLLVVASLFSVSAFAQNPTAQFSANVRSGCAPLSVSFSDQSSGGPKFWNWDFGNGALSNQQNASTTYSVPGTYEVTLVVRNENGVDGETKTAYITVFPSPSANFQSNIQEACLGSTIRFTDLSTDPAGTITSWNWNFGDGTTSTQRNPSKQFSENGFYTISLTVRSSTGCSNTATAGRYIRIFSGITNEFTLAQDSVCRAPFNVRFANESAGPGTLTYNWDFGNGNTSTLKDPSAVFNASGNYNIRLITTSQYGCSDTLNRSISVSGASPTITAPASACLNEPVVFTNASTPSTSGNTWDLGDGTTSTQTSPTHTYTTAGTYTIKLVSDFRFCKDSTTHTLVVNSNPATDFSATTQYGCVAPFNTNFTAIAPTAVSWQWNFGDGGTSALQNPAHTYNATGTYDVSLTITDANGCSNSIVKPAFIEVRPTTITANGLSAEGCAPFTYSPTANVNTIDPVVSWAWSFGDGNTATGATPSHTYATTGNYNVTLTVTTAGGCTATLTVPGAVRTGSLPGTGFSTSAILSCAGSSIQFTNTSLTSDRWEWDFGDGNSSTEENPTYAYNDTGYFTIQFTAVNNGCRQTITSTDYIRIAPPLAQFSYSVNCPANNKEVVFTNTSKVDNTLPLDYLWSFGDPASTTSTATNPTFTYLSVGSYTVSLRATNGGCTHTATQTIVIAEEPTDFSISKNDVCKYERITIAAINSNPAVINTYTWTINGGTPFSAGRNFDTSFFANGNYPIQLTITDVNGCSYTNPSPASVMVRGPQAGFTTSNTGACVNTDLQFTDASASVAPITRYRWDFGDGTIADNATPAFSHGYAAPGTYAPQLVVQDSRGCTDTTILSTTVLITSPKAGFTQSDTLFCPTLPVSFTDTSSGFNLSHYWTFGNGNTSTDQHPTNIFSGTDARYTVSLIVTDGYGCKDSVGKQDLIRIVKPIPAFTASDTTFLCPPAEVSFASQSSGYTSFYWDFANGNSSSRPDPVQFFNTYGDYNVKLYVVGYGGCLDSAQQTIHLPDPNSTIFNYSPVSACNELTVNFNITPPPDLDFVFGFGDGTTDNSGALSFSHYYGSPNYYSPNIQFTDRQGCIASVGGPSRIDVIGALPAFAKDRKEFCDQGQVAFTNYTIGNDPIVSTVWDFKDGGSSTDQNPFHLFTRPGTFPVTLTVTTQTGCSRSFIDTVRVYRTPVPVIANATGACIFDTLQLNGDLTVPDTSITWRWVLTPGGNFSGQNIRTAYSVAANVTATLTAENLLKCSGTTSATFTVFPLPTITIPGEITVPAGGSAVIPAVYSEDVNSWTWTPSSGLSCVNCAQPIASPQFNTSYTILVTDKNGCRTSMNVPVRVICNNQNFFIPNTFSPNQDGTNDVFYPRGKGIERIASMRIYNRWGQQVFERRNFAPNNPALGWNGMFNGKPAGADTYVYVVELICENASIIPYKGNVTLIR